MDGFRQGKAQGGAGGRVLFCRAEVTYAWCVYSYQLFSCQAQSWHLCPGWPDSWGNTCKLGSSYWYLWKECYFESLGGIPVDGKKPQMAVLSECQACCVSTWPLSCSKSWKSQSTELEHQEAPQRSVFCLTLSGTCFFSIQNQICTTLIYCTLARSYHSHGKDKGIPLKLY